ncbi:MAG: TerB family tellurite resistance protein [Bacteroidota bacterium]|nr:TerB family tellurite resistance protein [Bacteroidota bacterium]
MEGDEKILEGHSDLEKGAYLGAIASIATADRKASEEEMEYISQLCDAADLSPQQKGSVMQAATELSGDELSRCLDVLKKSDLRFSLVTDLMAFAKSDENYSEEEQENVRKIAGYLGVNQQQFSLLDQFAEKAKTSDLTPQETTHPDFLSSLGLKDKLQNAGISGSGLLKGLIGIAAPMILSGMLSRGLGRGRSSAGVGGGGSGMFGGGGLSSLIGMLSGGRGFGSTGGLLGKILGGGF